MRVGALEIEFYAALVESPENHAGDVLLDEPSPMNVSGRVVNRDRVKANAITASRPSRQRRIATDHRHPSATNPHRSGVSTASALIVIVLVGSPTTGSSSRSHYRITRGSSRLPGARKCAGPEPRRDHRQR